MSTATGRQDARSQKIAKHERYAADAFKNHVIRQDLNQGLFRSWRCGAPDDSNHHFHVTTTPGRIFIAGDNGTMVWERTDDMIGWCRGSIKSIEYFASKVPHEIKTREWDADVAREGFPDLSPVEFVAMFCKEMKCKPETVVQRIEFEYVPCYRVLTYDIEIGEFTPQQGVSPGPYTLFGLRKALRILRDDFGYDVAPRQAALSVLVERWEPEMAVANG